MNFEIADDVKRFIIACYEEKVLHATGFRYLEVEPHGLASQSLGRSQNAVQHLLGSVIEHGSFDMAYTVSGEVMFEKSAPEVALISFFLRLIARLQSLGTAPAIDIPEYLKALGPTMSS